FGMQGAGPPPAPTRFPVATGGGLGQIGGVGQLGQLGGFGQIDGGQLGFQGTRPGLPNMPNRLTYEMLQQRRLQKQAENAEAGKAGGTIAGLNFKEGIEAVASTEDLGDHYQYVLDQRITVPRQKSTMLPIIDQTLEG